MGQLVVVMGQLVLVLVIGQLELLMGQLVLVLVFGQLLVEVVFQLLF